MFVDNFLCSKILKCVFNLLLYYLIKFNLKFDGMFFKCKYQ